MNNIIKLYILGYLNVYYITVCRLLADSNKTFKEYKIIKIVSYLNLPSWTEGILNYSFAFLSVFEVVFSIILLTFRFFKSFFCCLITSDNKLLNTNIIIGAGEIKTKHLLSSSDYESDEIVVVTLPNISKRIYDGLKKVSVYSGIKIIDVIRSYYYSIKTILIISKKFAKRDPLTRSYSSFEYFLAYFYTVRSSTTNSFLFTSTYSRWALLHGHMKHKTVFLQHGWLANDTKYLNKAGHVDLAYYINHQQKNVCENLLFTNKPEAHYLKGIEFNLKPDSDKINILLICESGYREKEFEIISGISQNKDLRLYVKPHPKDKDIDVYKEIQDKYGFILLLGYNFPAVDYVISYESTLAVEYEMKGVETLVYERVDFEKRYFQLLNMTLHDSRL